MLTVSEFNDFEQLSQIRPLWSSLWHKTRRAHFHQTLEWLEQYWRHFGSGKRLRVLLASVSGRPVGLLPLAAAAVETPLGLLRVLGFPGSELGKAAGALGPHPTITLLAAMRHLQRSRKDWDVLDLHGVDHSGIDAGRTRNAMRASGLKPTMAPGQTANVVSFEGCWYEYWAARSRRLQSQYRTAENRLAASGPVKYLRFRSTGDAASENGYGAGAIADFQAVHLSSPTVVDGRAGRLFQDVHSAAVRAGCVDLNLLYVNSRPVAAAYNDCCNGRLECLTLCRTAAAPPEATTVLLGRMLRDSFDRGDEFLRLPGRHAELTADWCTSESQFYRLTHVPFTSLRARVLRLHERVHEWLNAGAAQPVQIPSERQRPQFAVVS